MRPIPRKPAKPGSPTTPRRPSSPTCFLRLKTVDLKIRAPSGRIRAPGGAKRFAISVACLPSHPTARHPYRSCPTNAMRSEASEPRRPLLPNAESASRKTLRAPSPSAASA
ncbi:MAG: hypothetical protein K2H72_00310 [Muribaculaceae bacterium]|nr:hypothetical protein [Muribaculaceae bacterium]